MALEIENSIHESIMAHVQSALVAELQTELAESHPLRPGVIKLGALQGSPMDPDAARISILIYENDPDEKDTLIWCDEPAAEDYGGLEIGGGITWKRRFTIKADCYFERSRESLEESRKVAGALKNRLESILLGLSFAGVQTDYEYVSRGAFGSGFYSRVRQSGGPPDAYQFFIKIRFEVLTTRTGVLP
jgi:hypothetical protein